MPVVEHGSISPVRLPGRNLVNDQISENFARVDRSTIPNLRGQMLSAFSSADRTPYPFAVTVRPDTCLLYTSIFKSCHTVFIGNSILINGQAAKRCAIKVELHTLHKIVLRVFDNLQTATLQGVVKGYGSSMTAYNRYPLNALRLVSVNGLLCDCLLYTSRCV